ncbi:hypothetical protein ElyMa_003379800 [Elysia marginata]|uniref:Uncharacterized protein n=1 Tax=Elysia marginata TaxID=1093978 RepID=A0AAV4JNW3_9GAST|nr:hypothetical protein ElyMa_003379800 [Elysia marginata]
MTTRSFFFHLKTILNVGLKRITVFFFHFKNDSPFSEVGAEFGVYEFDVLEDDLDPRPSYGVLSNPRTRLGLDLPLSRSEVVVTTTTGYPLRSDFVGMRQADDMASLVNQTSSPSLCSGRFDSLY